ncbi:UbiA prenyltransferase family [Lentinula aciculospora]|uniref:UbiA prenyltransferase family n=1 Tax=Lentinula aciculospora TaxID=153920 RepID=A0A9W9DRA5_9AGAR|nr:UbiA prenyltransferase family [Lentinula aciculospora]
MFNAIRTAIVTLYLFNKADMKTIVGPCIIFALALAKNRSWTSSLLAVFWLWIVLLQVTLTNQTVGNSPAEDAINKPNRPIPSGRISHKTARALRWIMLPIDLIISVKMGAFPAATGISILTALYNEGGLDEHWFTKNGCCAFFYGAFEYANTPTLSINQLAGIICSGLIAWTTIHAQDFRDDEGDRLRNRKTFTLLYPELSRLTIPVALIGWSLALFYFSQVRIVAKAVTLMLAIWVGFRFYALRDTQNDKWSYDMYDVWLVAAHYCLSDLQVEQTIVVY